MPRVACGACPRFHLSVGSSRLPFSTAFAFNGRRLFGDFPHLNSGRDLQIFDAHIFRCCFVLLIGAVPALWGPFSSPPVVLLVVALLLLLPLYPLFLLLLLLYLSLSLSLWLTLPLLSSVTPWYIEKDFAEFKLLSLQLDRMCLFLCLVSSCFKVRSACSGNFFALF